MLKKLALHIPPIRKLYDSRNSYHELVNRLRHANRELEQDRQELLSLHDDRAAEIRRLATRVGHLEQGEHTFSSCGEDIILRRIFFDSEKQHLVEKGCYVDIGAHHPIYASNTYYFYLNGWSGINVEANPYAIEAFNRVRPNDINVSCAIAAEPGEIGFYLFGDQNNEHYGSSSTTSAAFRDYIERTQEVKARTLRVPSHSLSSLLDEFLPEDSIEFMNLDIEGSELIALMSNDWERYRPLVMAIEVLPKSTDFETELRHNEVSHYVHGLGYRLFSSTLYTWFFYDASSERRHVVEGWMNFEIED